MTATLSIRQPWAWLILNAGKDIENRDWPTARRGRILIHAAKGMTRREWADGYDMMIQASRRRPLPFEIEFPSFDAFTAIRGGIVGSVEIVDCVRTHASPWFVGKFGFVLREPKPLPFAPLKGQLGFFVT